MKHTLKITILLLTFFLVSQLVGIGTLYKSIDKKATLASGNTTFTTLPYSLERPVVKESSSYIYILVAVLIGTILALVLVKFKKMIIWKVWFFFAVWLSLGIAFSVFINHIVAAVLALVLAIYKVFRPNVFVHNFTELFLYAGIALIFIPIMNIFSVFMLLLLISIYDVIAVWKTKHMITLATAQSEQKIFAGLMIPYKLQKKAKVQTPYKMQKSAKLEQVKTAVLGGGDIAFPLLFAGVVLKKFGLMHALVIPIVVSVALAFLLLKAKKDKFYPAMPFISLGCLVGYLLVLAI